MKQHDLNQSTVSLPRIPEGMEDGEPPYDPMPSIEAEIKNLLSMEERAFATMDPVLEKEDWPVLRQADRSLVPEIRAISNRIQMMYFVEKGLM